MAGAARMLCAVDRQQTDLFVGDRDQMQVSVESGEGLTKRLLVTLPAEQVNAVVDAKLKEVVRTVRLDGFRPGKVPVRVVKQRFGAQIRQDAYGELVQSSFYEAASQENLKPVG
ncbi:MAG TPA: hypothetical protein EYP90_08630, partial [Chromatiaceae bacterium]|nr:hypothetical protein [Chromatiaceae bacterium]